MRKTVNMRRILIVSLILAMLMGIMTIGVMAEGDAVAKVGDTEYATIDEAIAAWGNNSTLTLLADVTLSDVIKLKSTEHHTLDLGTYTMTAASGKNAIEITCEGRSSASYALTVNADATNPGGITATGKACIYYSKSDSTKDRPIIRIYNGVFNGSYSINSKSNGNTNCPQIWIYGGTFNGNVNLTKNMLRVFGGTFNGWINCTGDSSAYREISGGRFKSWQFMTADANTKFWVGTSQANYNVGAYVDDEGYLVVGGPVITEAGENFVASSSYYSGWSSYLKYSSVATNGLYYTSVEEALVDNNKASGNVTVYVEEIDMASFTSYKGTIVAPEGKTLTITNAPEGLKTEGDVVIVKPVAKIGETEYMTLAEAITAAKTGDTITFLADITENVTINKSITIDGADKTYTGTIKIEGNTKVVIERVAFVKGYIKQDSEAQENELYVKKCSFTSGGYAVETAGIKSVTIEECTVLGQSLLYARLTTSNIVVKNTTIERGNYLAYICYGDKAYFENVTATDMNYFGICAQNYGAKTITLKNCSIAAPFYAIASQDVATAIDTFVFVGNNNVDTVYDNQYNKLVLASGATLTAPEGLTNIDTNVEGYEVVYADGVYSLAEIKADVAKIGETGYETLAEALEAAQAGNTITFLADITEDVTIKKNLIIDGANFKYTGTITMNNGQGGTIKNVNFVKGNININNEVAAGAYTITDCSFDGQKVIEHAIEVARVNSVTIERCKVENSIYSFLYVRLTATMVTVKDVTVENVVYAVRVCYGTTASFEKLAVTKAMGGILADADITYTLKDCTFDSQVTLPLTNFNDMGAPNGTIIFEGVNTISNLSAGGKLLLASGATLTAPEGLTNIDTNVEGYKVAYVGGIYKLIYDVNVEKTNMRFGNSLSLLFAFTKHSGLVEDAYVVINGGTSIEFADWITLQIDNEFYYVVEFSGLAAKQMTDEVTVQIFANGNMLDEFTTTIRDYAMGRLANSNSETFKTLVVDMLNYGAAAQQAFNYKTDDLANASLTDGQKALATKAPEGGYASNRVLSGDKSAIDAFEGSNLRFGNSISFLFKVNKEIDKSVTFSYKNHYGKMVNIAADDITVDTDGNYVVELKNIVVADAYKGTLKCTITFTDGTSLTVTDDAASYAARATESKDVAEAFAKFAESSYKYLHTPTAQQ